MLYRRLNEHARAQPARIALRSIDGRELDYGALPMVLFAIQQWVRTRGVKKGEVLLLMMTNGPEMALALLGAALHASLSPIDPELGMAELMAIARHVGATGILTDLAHENVLGGLASSLGIPLHVIPFERTGPLGGLTGSVLPSGSCVPPEKDHILLMHRTSGTTGTSKRVPLRIANISAQAKNTAESLGLGPEDRILQVMPLFHMHGFGCLTGTLWSGGTAICTPGHDGVRHPQWMREFKPTWFSAAPTILRDVARCHDQDEKLREDAPLRFVRSLSASITPSLIHELERTTGAPVVEQYGLTEALSPVIANQPPPAPRKIGTLGRPYGCEVRIVDEHGEEVPTGNVGEIVLRGPGLITGYAEPQEVNDGSWFGEWFRTGDLGHIDTEGFVHLTGRLKEEINRGGEKIGPQEVEAALEGHPGIKAAAAFASPHPTLGDEVALAYVPVGGPVEADDLRRWMQKRIASHKVPKRFYPLEMLPVTGTGKVKRSELARIVEQGDRRDGMDGRGHVTTEAYERALTQALDVKSAGHATSDPEHLPASYIERTIAMVWGQELGKDRLLLTDDFFLLGGDSITGVRSCARLTEMLGCKLELADLFKDPTLKGLAASVSAQGKEQRWKNLAPIRLTGSQMPFVCVHGDEGNYNLPRVFDRERPFIGFMHQGEDGLGMRYKTIRSLARHYVRELLEALPAGPCIISGFSTGGVVAFEMARMLQAAGRQAPLLVILDARGPEFNWWRFAPRAKMADLRGDLIRPRCERYLDRGSAIPYKLRNFYIINTYRRALERYRPQPYDGDVLFIRSKQRMDEPTGWEGLLTGKVCYETVEGSHMTILREPYVHGLVDVMERHFKVLDV
ncbi:MAG: AMP-binding protein [Flavobacteriales bacterium]|nr:AMP-binding protein [Flavobacteriales bacterium]